LLYLMHEARDRAASHLDREHRVRDELSRPMVRNVATPVRPQDICTEGFDLARRGEHVRHVPAQAKRHYVRVLEQQQVVVSALIA